MSEDIKQYHPGTHFQGEKTEFMKKRDNEIITVVAEMYSQGLTHPQVLAAAKEKFPSTYIGPRCYTMKEGYKKFVMDFEVQPKEFYVKQSLIEYEEIKEEAKNVKDKKEGLKIRAGVIRDQNELLGLAKGGTVVEINFDSKNFSDEDFVNSMNVVDITVKEVQNGENATVEFGPAINSEEPEQ